MPRGMSKSIDDQIADIDLKIQTYQSKLNSLNSKKKALLASKDKEEMDALYQFVKASGKSPMELMSTLSK